MHPETHLELYRMEHAARERALAPDVGGVAARWPATHCRSR